jgi:hypothetical protein
MTIFGQRAAVKKQTSQSRSHSFPPSPRVTSRMDENLFEHINWPEDEEEVPPLKICDRTHGVETTHGSERDYSEKVRSVSIT